MKRFSFQKSSNAFDKYQTAYQRLCKSIQTGRFAKYAAFKKQSLMARLQRYERQLNRFGIAVASTAALFVGATSAHAQTPVGGTIAISGSSANRPKIARNSAGAYIVVWDAADASGLGIFARRFNSSGVAQGSTFQVNTHTTDNQSQPVVAIDLAGDFVIAWTSDNQDNGTSQGIYAQRYNPSGVAQGGEFLVNTTTADNQIEPAVAMDDAGDFVIAWQGLVGNYSETHGYLQRYNSAGVAQGGETEFLPNNNFWVNAGTTAVAMDSDGDFVAAMGLYDLGGMNRSEVFAQRYNKMGVAQGSLFQVNSDADFDQHSPSIGIDAVGNFVIAWISQKEEVPGSINSGIYAQRYNNMGVRQGSEFQVSTYLPDNQENPSLAMTSSGCFIVVWQSQDQDGSGRGIYGQMFNSSGTRQGSEFRINSATTGNQQAASVGVDGNCNFISVWQDDGQSSTIYGQGYLPTLVVLPVELLDFKGTPQYNGNLLTWTTAHEVNNKGFQIERRQPQELGGGNWDIIGFIKAQAKAATYTFTDDYRRPTVAYYRLRQIDNDGKETLSKIVSVAAKGTKGHAKLKAYPSVSSGLLTLEGVEDGLFHIYNLLGQEVITGKTAQQIDVSALPQGTYILKVKEEQVTFVKQ